MGIGLLGAMVVVGIAAIVLAVHLTGGSAPLRIDSAKAAEAFATEHPGEAIEAVHLDREGRAAILELPHAVGLVQSFGHRHVVRLLRPGELRSVEARGEELVVKAHEPGWSGGTYRVGEEAARRIAALLAADGIASLEPADARI